jgi:hypothetical protein
MTDKDHSPLSTSKAVLLILSIIVIIAQKYTQYMDNIRREALRQEQQNSPGTVQ